MGDSLDFEYKGLETKDHDEKDGPRFDPEEVKLYSHHPYSIWRATDCIRAAVLD